MASGAFGGGSEPFGIFPDPRFIYFDEKLRREQHVLLDGLRTGACLAWIVGGHGLGKTMLLQRLAADLNCENNLVAYVCCLGTPSLGDIISAFATQIGLPEQFGEPTEADNPDVLYKLLDSVGACGTTAILLLDDADGLSAEALSSLAAMSHEGAGKGSAISIVLASSSDLARKLDEASGPSPRRKLGMEIALAPLDARDTEAYIVHRLHVAGYEKNKVFEPEAIARIAQYSRGNPQAINRICRSAMVFAATQSEKVISASIVDEVAPGGGGGQRLETIAAVNARRPSKGATQSDPACKTRMNAVSSNGGSASRPETDGSSPTVTASEAATAGTRDDKHADNTRNAEKLAFGRVSPSGQDLTAQIAAETKSSPPRRARGHRRLKWAALGVLLAIGIASLYLIAGGETSDRTVASTEVPADTSAQESMENVSAAKPPAAVAPVSKVEPGNVTERASTVVREDTAPSKSWESSLEEAVFQGDVKTVAALLDSGADINAPVSDGGTLLVIAAENGDADMVSYLIDRGADPSFGTIDVTDSGSDGLFSNLEEQSDELTSSLKQPAPTQSASEFSTAAGSEEAGVGKELYQESRQNLAREVLLSTAGDGHGPRDRSLAPVISAPGMPQSPNSSHADNTDVAVTSDAGSRVAVNFDMPPDLGVTPLIAAARGGHAKAVKVLLAANAEVNVADARGQTPLIAAVNSGDKETTQLLLAQGADIYAMDDTGQSALGIARKSGRWDIVHVISSYSGPRQAETTATPLWTNAQPAAVTEPTDAEKALPHQQPQGETTSSEVRSVQAGMQSKAQVIHAQRYLRNLGYDPGPIDGLRGSKTKSAVIAFQTDRGTKTDGKITPNLLSSLAAEANAREARRLAAETPAQGTTPKSQNQGFFGSILSGLQRLRGLELNSAENPEQLRDYCGKNRDTWVFDNGTGRSVFCKEYVKNSNL